MLESLGTPGERTMSVFEIRPAEISDLPALLTIYNHYVENTPVIFDIGARTLEQRRVWFDQFASGGPYQCLVGVKGGCAIGWASSVRFKERAAYDTTVETSIYLAPEEIGQGYGRRLYGALFDAIGGHDLHRAFGGITLPNPASVGVHTALGFVPVGVLHEVGRKFCRYWDVGCYEKALR